MGKGLQIAIAALTVFVALGFMMSSNEGAFQYFATVSELSGSDVRHEDGLRVHGYVIDGSIARDTTAHQVAFAIHDKNPQQASAATAPAVGHSIPLQVRYDGIDVPDLFRDGAEVVVEGGFQGDVFVARKIMAKCPSKYEVAPSVPDQKA
jgi:cytochrome c-type biogenesis protein CcmE